MDYQEMLKEIKNPEKEICELKSSFNEWDGIAKTIASFSTKRGGTIYVGIDRRGYPCGTSCSNEIRGRLQGLADNEIKPSTQISVELINHDSKRDLVVARIHVQKGNGVYGYKGIHYERRGDVNHPLTADEIFEIQKRIKKLYFDEMPAFSEERPALISDIDETKVNQYLSETKKIKESFDIRRFLSNNSYLVNGGHQVKNAAIMIFGKDPQRFIPQMTVSLSIFSGKTITDQFVKKEFTGDLFDIYQRALIEIQRSIKIYSFIEGTQRLDIPEYPFEVIRECLINSIVHRDYFDKNTETFIKIFTDRIEFVNPATFPFEGVTFDEIRRTKLSKRRNPLVATFFESLRHMENEGRGITKIENGMMEHGLPTPIFEAGDRTFMVVIKNSENKKILIKSPYKRVVDFGSLNKRQTSLINNMNKQQRTISRNDYMNLIKSTGEPIPALTASRDLRELVEKNILTKIGDKRGARYSLT